MKKSILIKNKIEELENINTFLENLADEWAIDFALVMSLNLVIEEAFTNIVKYAYKDNLEHDIEIQFELENKEITISLLDDGEHYDPTQEEDPDVTMEAEDREIGGLGIFLIRQMMDTVNYKRNDNKNILEMTKKL